MGGGVNGDDPEEVFRHLRQVVDEWVTLCKQDGVPLPEAKHALASSWIWLTCVVVVR